MAERFRSESTYDAPEIDLPLISQAAQSKMGGGGSGGSPMGGGGQQQGGDMFSGFMNWKKMGGKKGAGFK